MPAYLLPADKLTHAILGLCVTLVLLPFGVLPAALACAAAAIGREVYGWHKRGWTMTRADAIEHGKDIGSTLAGGGAVLAAAFIGV